MMSVGIRGRVIQASSVVVVLVVVGGAVGPARAQHDPQRNATRLIAKGKFAAARTELGKGEPGEPETHFVAMMAALKQGRLEEGVERMRLAVAAGLPFGRLVAGPRDLLGPLYASDAYRKLAKQHGPADLVHGPMLGDVSDTAAAVWLRTARASRIVILVRDLANRAIVLEAFGRTMPESDFTAVVRLTGLKPGQAYSYQVLVDGRPQKAANTRFRTTATVGQPGETRIVFGGGAGYVPIWERMWDTIGKRKPDALLMLGDNVYIDAPTETLTTRYCYYRRQSRPEWRRLVAGTPVYAIYDDHDFGTNDCVPGPEIEQPPWKRRVWSTFTRNWCNPYYGGGEKQPGCWCDFRIGDLHVILLDGRYYRTRGTQPSMLGPVQMAWLKRTLKASKGTFKILASPVPWSVGVKPRSRDTWDGFAQEREEIFRFIETERINGVILISADRHRTDLRVTKRAGGYDLYELESSKLTNRHTHSVVKTPGLIWGYNKTCSFAVMEFDTTAKDPQVKFEAVTIDGERVHEHLLRLSQLTHRTTTGR